MDISGKYRRKQDDDSGEDRQLAVGESCSELVLIPGLPNHLSHLCLSSLNPFLLYSVCHSWRRFIYSPDFPQFFSLYALLSPSNGLRLNSNIIQFFTFDPISSKWNSHPLPPSNPRILYRHPSFISRKFPIQSLTVSGRFLLLIAATTHNFLPALRHPLLFDPLTKNWFFGPPLNTPRRWCIAAAGGTTKTNNNNISSVVYVASGVGSCFQSDVARAVEKWNINGYNINEEEEWKWEKIATYKDGRFSREANEGIEYKGKLCMVNIKGHAVKDGAVYNTLTSEWEEMAPGMLAGWQGPVAMDYERQVMYVVDEENGVLSKYDPDCDRWEEVIKSPENLTGATQISAGRGRVCAVSGTPRITIVDVANNPARIWVLNIPPEMEPISVHILPRMTY